MNLVIDQKISFTAPPLTVQKIIVATKSSIEKRVNMEPLRNRKKKNRDGSPQLTPVW